MTCRRTLPDLVVQRGAHIDPPEPDHDPRCHGCRPCPTPAERHCKVCTRHLTTAELGTCDPCRGQTRRDLNAITDLATLLPTHALHAAHEGHLIAAAPIPGGEALVMLARGSEGLSDDNTTTGPDEPLPPSYVLGWWEETWRTALDLDSKPAPWRRRPARVLTQAHAFLDEHLNWAASHHPGFGTFANDLTTLRTHLEDVLTAGTAPSEGVPCFNCNTTLLREYRDPRPCQHPTPARDWIHTLTSYGLRPHQAELNAARHPCGTCDQGGLDVAKTSAGWYCPRCRHHYTVGEYDLALRTDYDEVAAYRRIADAARLTGAKPGTIRVWASRNLVRRRRDADGCVTYNLDDIDARHAHTTGDLA